LVVKRLFLLSLLLARPVLAGYAARDLVFPIIGRASSASGQTFLTSIWITNVASQPASVTLSFLEAGHANPSPRTMRIDIAPGATRVFDPLDAPVGALQIHSNADLIASARISDGAFSTSCAAIPARFAIGNGQSSVMQGYVTGAGQYRLYLVETKGEPLAYAITVSDAAGHIRGEKRLYIDRSEELRLDLAAMFPAIDGAVVKIEGINGSGKIIALGLQRMPGAQDASAFEMSFPSPSRFAMSWIEGTTYALVALAAIVAALIRR
jgi:hypothetical protein